MPGEQSARLLIVDDEVAQMRALCDTLQTQGYETIGFATGEAALAAMRTARFDLLLADLAMPGMDGISLLQAAQKIDTDLVGIIMTGEGTIATAVEAMKVGALDYILKPFKLSVILPVLSRALSVRDLRLEIKVLEQNIRDRTVELEAMNKELEAYAYSVSHDLRTPLTLITGYTEILIEKYAPLLPDDAREILNLIADRTDRMALLVSDLLRLSHLGRQPLTKGVVPVGAIVSEILSELRAELTERKIDVRTDHLANCVGDSILLRQVFMNLLSNAVKFTRGKENPRVEVSCLQGEGEKIYEVRDNGAGFDMSCAKDLFGAFQRLHSTTQFEGNGIGLSIAQRIIQRHGGRIWAEAEIDRGATFRFSVPD
ncbi:MAG TPA: ATP-binding protein [Dongiaceae bacterium]|nr:ATP-binding protein [Dongiaceae bacterium]